MRIWADLSCLCGSLPQDIIRAWGHFNIHNRNLSVHLLRQKSHTPCNITSLHIVRSKVVASHAAHRSAGLQSICANTRSCFYAKKKSTFSSQLNWGKATSSSVACACGNHQHSQAGAAHLTPIIQFRQNQVDLFQPTCLIWPNPCATPRLRPVPLAWAAVLSPRMESALAPSRTAARSLHHCLQLHVHANICFTAGKQVILFIQARILHQDPFPCLTFLWGLSQTLGPGRSHQHTAQVPSLCLPQLLIMLTASITDKHLQVTFCLYSLVSTIILFPILQFWVKWVLICSLFLLSLLLLVSRSPRKPSWVARKEAFLPAANQTCCNEKYDLDEIWMAH